ncbi:MAG: hotdog fold thioesterase, partial [Alphaproteobacteria bacterium]|nr:hotdog fold thioesterase [Alphaproteobacteria bacterium]
MEPASFLDRHQNGLGKVLGITFPYAARHRVIAQLELEPELLAPAGAVSGGVIMALADCANSYGATLDLPPGHRTATIESKTNFLGAGRGNTLRAEASPVHRARSISVWRAVIFRDEAQIADVTQTQMTVEDGCAADPLPREGHERRPGAGHAVIADGFSKAVVDERWRRIVEGASKVIAAKGFAKATIREIAAASEMPVATMYQYLERKEDILYNVYKFFMTDIVTALARWRSSDLPPKERLGGAIRTIIDVFDQNHRFIKLMFQESRSLTPEARRQVYELDAQYIAIFRELLQEAEDDLRIRNVELAANFVYFLCTIWPLRFWSIGKFGEEAVTKEIIDFVLGGLGAGGAGAAGR